MQRRRGAVAFLFFAEGGREIPDNPYYGVFCMTDIDTTRIDEPTSASPSWRERLAVHPAAEVFPAMSGDELAELGSDIQQHGLQMPIILLDTDGAVQLLDGRNRLDAMERAGVVVVGSDGKVMTRFETIEHRKGFDPFSYVCSLNLHRRHLTRAHHRAVVLRLLQANPERSDRATAKIAQVSAPTVAAVRREAEAGVKILHLEKRVGADGKAQPAGKTRVAKELSPPLEVEPSPVEPPSSAAEPSALEPPTVPPSLGGDGTLGGLGGGSVSLSDLSDEQLAALESLASLRLPADEPEVVVEPDATDTK